MQELARQAKGRTRLTRAIERVAQHGSTFVGEMHPNLVGPPGLEPRLDQGILAKLLQHAPAGARMAAIGHDPHANPVGWVAGDRRVNQALRLLEATLDDHKIGFEHGAGLLLGLDLLERKIVAGADQQARGVAIEPVDNPRAQVAARR